MYSVIFAFFCLAFLLFYGMLHSLFFARKSKHKLEYKNSFLRYAKLQGLYGCLSLALALVLYYYGIS